MDQRLDKLNQLHNIKIGHDLNIASDLKSLNLKFSTIVIVTDTHLEPIYLDALKNQFVLCPSASPRILSLTIPPGESSKSRSTKATIEDWLLEHGCDRESCLIALGGGVIGDLVGFVASTYLRGISFIQVPTSLLAMVDSSIGAKNGIDTKHGKNLIGTYWPAKRIYVDTCFLKTLPAREFANGMAEVIKMAIVGNCKEFERLEKANVNVVNVNNNNNATTNGIKKSDAASDEKMLLNLTTTAIEYKTAIVSQDRHDSGLRHLLNFGHTIGHGIEALVSPKLLHGECISIGMMLETKISIKLGHCSPDILKRLEAVLCKYGLPTSLSQILIESTTKDDEKEAQAQDKNFPTVEQIIKILGVDKKNSGGNIQMILLTNIGTTLQPKSCPIPLEIIKQVLYAEFQSLIHKDIEKEFGLPVKNQAGFGSTIGHCLESIFTPGGFLLANECEALGMILETRLGAKLGYVSWERLHTLETILCKYKLPTSLGAILFETKDKIYVSIEQMVQILLGKKQPESNSSINFELPTQIDKSNQLEPISVPIPAQELQQLFYEEFETYIHKYLEAQFGPKRHAINSKFVPSTASSASGPSFFLCLTSPNLTTIETKLPSLVQGVDAVELRVDLLLQAFNFNLKDSQSCLSNFLAYVEKQIRILRSCVPDMPIIYTPRSVSEGGVLPDDTPIHVLLAIYLLGFHLGCELIDVQVTSCQNIINSMIQAKNSSSSSSKIIASYHQWTRPLDWCGPEVSKIVQKASQFGNVIKIVSTANTHQDNKRVEIFSNNYWENHDSARIPLIAFNIGELGQVSRIQNRYLSPVTHKELQEAAPGQLTAQEIMAKVNAVDHWW